MIKKDFIRLLAIMLVIMCGGLSLTTANAAYPVLMLDFGANKNRNEIEPGFDVFTLLDSGSTVKNITISLGKIEPDPPIAGKPAKIDSRSRWAPTGIPYEWIYRDFIFAMPGGIRVTLSGLWPNQTYEITIWAYDVGSGTGGNRIADWYANGVFCLTTNFIGTTSPTDEYSHAFTGSANSDETGKIVLESYPNENTTEQSGENNPYTFINALRIASVAPITEATNPTPEDGATEPSTKIQLGWMPGMFAASHNVYFGETFEDVNKATTTDPEYCGPTDVNSFSIGSAGQPYPTGLPADKTYYWRIDEVNEPNVWKGRVWSLYVPTKTAYNPSPVDGALYADPNFPDPDIILDWYQAADATSYHMYFGDNFQNVQNGTGGTDKGTTTDPNYDPPGPAAMLQLNMTYYWRVDSFDGTTTHTGAVWSFKTSPEGLGTITMDIWENVDSPTDGTGHFLANLLDDPRYPDSPTRSEELTEFGTVDGVGTNYGGRIHGWLYVPLTGDYTFYFTSAGQGQLFLSTDGDPANLMSEPLAAEYVWGSYNVFTHRSDPIPLIGGNRYYIMAIWKDFDAWDHCQVAWQGAGIRDQEIIRGCYLSPQMHEKPYSPYPRSSSTDVEINPILMWMPGIYADKHDIYFGTDFNVVSDANRTNDPCGVLIEKGYNDNYYPLSGTLDLSSDQTYYWRVDDVNDPNIYKGSIWIFTTGKCLAVDNMEYYGDAPTPGPPPPFGSRIWYTWKDGEGWTEPSPVEGNGTGSLVNLAVTLPFIRSGGQSLKFDYTNFRNPYYSELERTFDSPEDWTGRDVKSLTLWFYGNGTNSAEPLYVALKDSLSATPIIANYPDPYDLLDARWHEWNIDLRVFDNAGVDLNSVETIYIGVGDRTAPQAGGTGTLYLDDIRLYQARCLASIISPDADLNGDCVVGYEDVGVVADQWLDSGLLVTPVTPGSTNLVGHWKFDDGSGMTVTDSSGKGNDGFLMANPDTAWIAGYDGGALRLDGDDEYVDFPTLGSLIGSLTKSTFAIWVNFAGPGDGYERIFDFGNDETVYMYLTPRAGATGPLRFEISTAASGVGIGAESPDTLPFGWRHVAVTISDPNTAGTRTIRLYLDGAQVGTNTQLTFSPQDLGNTENNWLGRSQLEADYYTGRLDDFRIYNRTLSAGEVASLAGKTETFSEPFDLNVDGTVDLKDYAKLASMWLEEQLWP